MVLPFRINLLQMFLALRNVNQCPSRFVCLARLWILFLRLICFFMAVVNQGGLSFLIEIIILGIVSLAMSVIICVILHVMESVVYKRFSLIIWGGSRGSDHCACLTGSDVTGSHVTVSRIFPPYFFSRIFPPYFFKLFFYFFPVLFQIIFFFFVLFFPVFLKKSIGRYKYRKKINKLHKFLFFF